MRTSFPGQVFSAARCRVEIVRKRATQTTPCTSFKVLMKSQSRPAEGAARMQKLHQTAQTTLPLHLNASTATKPDAKLPTVGPVDITLVIPRSGVNAALPWVMLMSGTFGYSQDHSFLLQQLAGRGYLVAIVDQNHPINTLKLPLPEDRDASCPTDTWPVPTASIFNDVHTILSSLKQDTPCSILPDLSKVVQPSTQQAFSDVKLDSAVLLGHSRGGMIAVDMVFGVNIKPEQTDCKDYTKILDKDGKDIIKGVILFEGWNPTNQHNLVVPDDIFLTYVSNQNSPFAAWTALAFERTEGRSVDHIQLRSGNHFAINDWNPKSAPHQVTPCGLGDIVNASTNFTTQKEQEDRLTLLSELTDATMRAHVLKDSAAASFLLKELPHNPFVQTAQFSLTLPDNSEKT